MLAVKTPKEVFEIIETEFQRVETPAEIVPLVSARGRILAEDIEARDYVPAFHRSTVDGYAVKAADTFGCSDSIPAILKLEGEVLMGAAATMQLTAGSCAAVPTGGEIPQGADAVVMIEYTEEYGDGTIGILKPIAPAGNMIFKGDDVYPGKLVLEAGRKLKAQDIGTLAAMGYADVKVSGKLTVGIISTGDELVPVEEVPGQGQVRNVNSALLRAAAEGYGVSARDFGIVPDEESLLLETVKTAAAACDLVLLSGGSSVGTKDAASRVIASLGEILFHGIAIKPGKPTIFGKIGGKAVIGLPGHPAAAFFVTHLFVRPLLARLQGIRYEDYQVRAKLTETVGANHGRAQYTGVHLEQNGEEVLAHPIRGKSGLITALAGSDGYFCIPRDCEGVAAGETILVTLYER